MQAGPGFSNTFDLEFLAPLCQEEKLSDGQTFRVINDFALTTLAEEEHMPLREVEIAVLQQEVVPERYVRNFFTLSCSDQITLLESSVALVGLGGLGGILLEQLVRMGVGRIRGVDGDVFEESNLNRQALATTETLGLAKAEAALERAAVLNPAIDVATEQVFLEYDGFLSFFEGHDLAVDCLGGLKERLSCQKAASETGIPFVTGALAGWTGYVSVVMPGGTGPAAFMGTDDATWEGQGCPAPTVNCVASIMCAEIISMLTKKTSPLQGKMLFLDMATADSEIMTL